MKRAGFQLRPRSDDHPCRKTSQGRNGHAPVSLVRLSPLAIEFDFVRDSKKMPMNGIPRRWRRIIADDLDLSFRCGVTSVAKNLETSDQVFLSRKEKRQPQDSKPAIDSPASHKGNRSRAGDTHTRKRHDENKNKAARNVHRRWPSGMHSLLLVGTIDFAPRHSQFFVSFRFKKATGPY